jgi:hypothetical protein
MSTIPASLTLRTLLLSLLIPAAGFAQIAATPAVVVPSALKQAVDTAHAAWKQQEAAEFKTGLTYVQGVPTLMLITTVGEPADKSFRRRRAILSACDFLLDDTTFAKANICVVTVDPQNPKSQATTNYEIRRGNYQESVKKAAKVSNVKEGAVKARETDSVVNAVSTELGLK